MTTFTFDVPERFDSDTAGEGIWIECYSETTLHYGDFKCRYFDGDSREATLLISRLKTKYAKEIRTTQDPVALKELDDRMAREAFISSVLIDWRGVKAGGKEVAFSAAAAKAYFDLPSTKFVFRHLVAESQDVRNFQAPDKDEIVKNL